MQTYTTTDGGTVEAVRRGFYVDLHYRNAAGRTVATVVMDTDDACALLNNLDDVL